MIVSVKDYVFLGIIVVLLGCMFFMHRGYSAKEVQQQIMIDSLNKDISQNKKDIVKQDSLLIRTNEQMDSVNEKLSGYKDRINTLRKNYEKNSNIINSFDVDQLQQFFSDYSKEEHN